MLARNHHLGPMTQSLHSRGPRGVRPFPIDLRAGVFTGNFLPHAASTEAEGSGMRLVLSSTAFPGVRG